MLMQTIKEIQTRFIEEFELLVGAEKFDYLIDLGQSLPEMSSDHKTEANLVKGCQSSVWFSIHCEDERLFIEADSDSLIIKGISAMLVTLYSGQKAQDILATDNNFIEQIGLWRQLSSQRGNGLTAMLSHIHAAAVDCFNRESTLPQYKVLFLCTGNSCRSQMAEAIVNDRLGETWQAFSAGTQPAGYVHPKALAALQEIDIHHSGLSKHVDQFKDQAFDLVITVCDSAAEECPIWLGQGKRIHHSFPDPARTDNMEDFRAIRDAIADTIPVLLKEYKQNITSN